MQQLQPETVIPDAATERRAFVMHENLLRDVIQRQAGSIGKAVLEGVMNLIEAGATEGQVTLEPSRVVIKDNGRGFESRDEVLEAFEVFGKSEERKAKAGRWAEFQMGRGQLMAFGRTTYRTRTFEMVVDISKDARGSIGYELRQGLDDVPGCIVTVELFEELDEWGISYTIDEIKRAIRYVDIPVSLNGQVVTVNPALEKWSFEDENAYYRVSGSKGDLALYNLGVFVDDQIRWGVGGVIVSKKRLLLNFARNDVLSKCPVWKAILKQFKERTGAAVLEKKAPTAKEVGFIVEELFAGRFPIERVMQAPILRDINGRRLAPGQLVYRLLGIGYKVEDVRIEAYAVDRAKSEKADYAMQSRPWVILDSEFCREAFDALDGAVAFHELGALAEVLEMTTESIVGGVKSTHRQWYADLNVEQSIERVTGAFRNVQQLYAELDFTAIILPDEKLSRDETTVLTALRGANSELARICAEKPRKLVVGVSEGALAWTDGNRIVIDRDFLRRCLMRQHGMLAMLHTLLHEYTHTRAQLDGHDLEFYKRFHDAAMRVAPLHNAILSRVMRVANNRLKTFGKALHDSVEARRRVVREGLRVEGDIVLPCPLCSVFGAHTRVDRKDGGSEWLMGASGVPLNVLTKACRSEESFESMFGARWVNPQTWETRRAGARVACPICEDGSFPAETWPQITKEVARRACDLALVSASAGVTPSLAPVEGGTDVSRV